jgi:hypothetical protein
MYTNEREMEKCYTRLLLITHNPHNCLELVESKQFKKKKRKEKSNKLATLLASICATIPETNN